MRLNLDTGCKLNEHKTFKIHLGRFVNICTFNLPSQWQRSVVFIVNFEHISHLFLMFLLLTSNMQLPAYSQQIRLEIFFSWLNSIQEKCYTGNGSIYFAIWIFCCSFSLSEFCHWVVEGMHICDALLDVVLFVQFKKFKNIHGRV